MHGLQDQFFEIIQFIQLYLLIDKNLIKAKYKVKKAFFQL